MERDPASSWSAIAKRWVSGWLRGWRGIREAASRNLGAVGEACAERHLKRRRFIILERNHRNAGGEIDLIAVERRSTLVFVEVKTRSDDDLDGSPGEAIDRDKRIRITRAALVYVRRHQLIDVPIRFDVVTVLIERSGRRRRVEHQRGAFEAEFTELCTRRPVVYRPHHPLSGKSGRGER